MTAAPLGIGPKAARPVTAEASGSATALTPRAIPVVVATAASASDIFRIGIRFTCGSPFSRQQAAVREEQRLGVGPSHERAA